MRIQIKADSATPEQVFNLTRAFQRTLGDDDLPTVMRAEPTVTVLGSAMGWETPPITRRRAASILREFDRLEAGLFDAGTEAPNGGYVREFNDGAVVVSKDDTGGKVYRVVDGEPRADGTILVGGKVKAFRVEQDRLALLNDPPRHERRFADDALVQHPAMCARYVVVDGQPDYFGRIWVRGEHLSDDAKTLQHQREFTLVEPEEDPIGGDTETGEESTD